MGRSGGGNRKKQKSGKNNKNNNKNNHGALGGNNPTSNQQELLEEGGGFMWVDPIRVRFQHSKIRPYFSGCGRSIYSTLDSIRKEEIIPDDLPPIQVIVGPPTEEEEGPWYFSLNNRRLWVLKRCREEGLLSKTNNRIKVRVRTPKSTAEALRYTIENCALEAKVIREKPPQQSSPGKKNHHSSANGTNDNNSKEGTKVLNEVDDDEDEHKRKGTDDEKGTMIDDDEDQSSKTSNQLTSHAAADPDSSEDEDDNDSNDSDDDDDYTGSFGNKNRFSALLL